MSFQEHLKRFVLPLTRRQRPTALPTSKPSSILLTDLPLEILRLICDAIPEQCPDGIDLPHFKPIDGLSRTNRMFRELSLPILFRTIAIRGDWGRAYKCILEMERPPDVARYIRLLSP